jgi:hypothetical protein
LGFFLSATLPQSREFYERNTVKAFLIRFITSERSPFSAGVKMFLRLTELNIFQPLCEMDPQLTDETLHPIQIAPKSLLSKLLPVISFSAAVPKLFVSAYWYR